MCAGLLRVAIGLDRGHDGRVERVHAKVGPRRLLITAVPAGRRRSQPRAVRRRRAQTPVGGGGRPPGAHRRRLTPAAIGPGRRRPAGADCDTGPMSARDRWQQEFDDSEKRAGPFDTMSGVPVEPVYGPDDGEFPGQYPYTRGPYASMYRSKLWTMRMFAGFGTAPDTNQRFQAILALGRRRSLHRLRPADAHGPRLRRPAERGRGRQVRRRRRHAWPTSRTSSPGSTSATSPRR